MHILKQEGNCVVIVMVLLIALMWSSKNSLRQIQEGHDLFLSHKQRDRKDLARTLKVHFTGRS